MLISREICPSDGSAPYTLSFENSDSHADEWIFRRDNTLQSSIDIVDPSNIRFTYVKRMCEIFEESNRSKDVVSVLALGGGAMTIPRYIEHTKPGSEQIVVEIDKYLISFVQDTFPVAESSNIRIRLGDAFDVLLSISGVELFDAVIVDIYEGVSMPRYVETIDFHRAIKNSLLVGGVVIFNIVDSAPYLLVSSIKEIMYQVYGNCRQDILGTPNTTRELQNVILSSVQ